MSDFWDTVHAMDPSFPDDNLDLQHSIPEEPLSLEPVDREDLIRNLVQPAEGSNPKAQRSSSALSSMSIEMTIPLTITKISFLVL